MKDGKPCVEGHEGPVGKPGTPKPPSTEWVYAQISGIVSEWFASHSDASDAGYSTVSTKDLPYLVDRVSSFYNAFGEVYGPSIRLQRFHTTGQTASYTVGFCPCRVDVLYTFDGPRLTLTRCRIHDIAGELLAALQIAEPYLAKMVADDVQTAIPPSKPLAIVRAAIARATGGE